jgi:hypothetical protein
MLTDFRLCNYAYSRTRSMIHPEIFDVIKVSVKNEVTIQGVMSGKIFRRKELIPIKITAPWLENLGLIQKGNQFIKDLEYQTSTYLVVEEITPEYFDLHLKNSTHRITLDPVQYIHQLQNLYFGLTTKQLRLPQLE